MMTRVARRKVAGFVVVSALSLGWTAAEYVRLPALFGMGQYTVTVQLDEAHGLYPKAEVTYRGVTVGSVRELSFDGDGIEAELRIDDDVSIPSDVVAEVHSVSAVGEQYVNLVPRSTGGEPLESGSVIPQQDTETPVATTELIDELNELVHSVPDGALRTTVDEMYAGLATTPREQVRILDSSEELLADARDAQPATIGLLEDAVPVLRTQRRHSPDLASYLDDLASWTGQLEASDRQLRTLLREGPGFADETTALVDDLAATLPPLMADLASWGEVLDVYRPGIEHILTVLPATLEATMAGAPASRLDDPYPESNLSFKVGVNDPPVCIQGFEDAHRHRDPSEVGPAPFPDRSWCKVAPSDPRAVRGARNQPCPQDPYRRGPDAASCGLLFEYEPFAPQLDGRRSAGARGLGAPDVAALLTEGEAGTPPRTWQELVRLPLDEGLIP